MPLKLLRCSRIIFAACSLLVLSACNDGQKELLIVTPAEQVDAEVLVDLIGRLNEFSTSNIRMTDEPLSDLAALDAVASGQADLAMVSNIMPFREGVETVMPLYPTLLHVAAMKDRDTSSAAAVLKGAKVFAGPEGSASRLVFERFISLLHVDKSTFSYIAGTDGAPDVIVVFAPIAPARIAEFPDYQLFSMGRPGDIGTGNWLDAAVLLDPVLRPFVIPSLTYGAATPQAVVTVSVDRMLVARSELSSATVYDLINSVLRLRPPMSSRWPGLFFNLSDDFDVSHSSFNIHSGTQAYLQRSAPNVYERYSGVAEVAITILIALISASVAGVRIYHRYRKNRIDVFCARAIELRRSVSDTATRDERDVAIQAVRDLQAEAFELLADEKLAADESFQIFITLATDVIRQIDLG